MRAKHTINHPPTGGRADWLTGLSALLLGLLVVALAWGLNLREQARMQEILTSEVNYLNTSIANDLGSRLPAFKRMALRWERRGGTPAGEFLSDARAYLADMPGIQAIQWVDRDFRLRLVEPLKGNAAVRGFDLLADPVRRQAIHTAHTTMQPAMSAPVELVQGGQGLLVYFPLRARGQFDGFIVAVIKLEPWLAHIFKGDHHHDLGREFRLALSVDKHPVLTQPGWNKLGQRGYEAAGSSRIMDHTFTLKLRPTPQFLADHGSRLPLLMTLAAGLLALLLSVIVHLLQTSYTEAQALRTAKAALETEMLERRRTEQALAETLARMDLATRAGGIGVWAWDIASNRLSWNERMYQLYDIPTDVEPSYATWHDSLHPADLAATEALLNNAVAGRAVFNTEFRILHSNGAVRYLGGAARVERDSAGQARRVTGINWDTTERRLIEEALRESEEKFRALADSTPTGIMVYQNNQWTYANPAAETIAGYNLNELVKMNFWEIVHPEQREMVRQIGLKRQSSEPTLNTYEVKILSRSGQEKWINVTGASTSLGGRPTGILSIIDITGRRQIEEALRLSEERIRLLLNSTGEAIYGIDLDGNCTFANQACLRLLGYNDLEQLLGRNMHKLIHYSYPDGRPMPIADCRIYRAFHEGQRMHVDDEVLWRSDGSCFAAEYWSYPQFVDEQIVGAVVTFIDITQRKRMQEDLENNRRFLSEVIEHSSALICVKDLQGRYELVNSKWEQTTGLLRQTSLGRTDAELFGPAAGEAFHHNDLSVIETGRSLETEEIIADPQGRKRFFISLKFPLFDTAGQVSGVCAMVTEITERKSTEDALARERQRLANILEGTNAGTWEWNVQTGEAAFNERWAAMLGYSLSELAPVSIQTWLRLAHPDDLSASELLLQRHFSRELPYYEHEARLRHKDGSWIWVLDRGKVVSWTADDQPLIMSGTHQEITARKLAEEKISHLATHDGLTDLPSLRLAEDRLNMALAATRRNRDLTAVLFIDLDGFKAVNDSLGHDFGDTALKQVAARLLDCVRASDTVARIGGDEFLIVVGGLKQAREAALIAEKIITAVARPITANGQQAGVGASIGIALAPDDSENRDQLIKLADAAMYRIKNAGKNGYGFAGQKLPADQA